MGVMDLYYRLPPTARNWALQTYGAWQAYQRFSGKFSVWYETLMKTQYLDVEDIKSSQFQFLKDLLDHAYSTVPYYNRLFNQYGIKPDDVTSLDDFSRLPTLSKEDVVNSFNSLQSSQAGNYQPFLAKSSGSTGLRITYLMPRELKSSFSTANQWRFYSWSGVKLGTAELR